MPLGSLHATVRIGVVGGTGREGYGLALRWAAAGRPVIIGSRFLHKALRVAERVRRAIHGAWVEGMKNLDAAKVADVIVLAIPYVAQGDILPEIREAVEGKVVVDTTVPLRSVVPPELERIPEGSSAQRVQSLLPGSKVVCGLHTVSAARLRRLGEPLEGDVLLCGDDDVAKGIVMELVRDLGMRALDAGGLARAASLEHLALLVLTLNHKYGTREIGVRFVGV